MDHFVAFVLVSLIGFVGILRFSTRRRATPLNVGTLAWVASVVVGGGMLFAKIGAQTGMPIALYYGLPALGAWLIPPLTFRMDRAELGTYLPLAVIMAPAIHVLFSFFLGWNEYMPFIPVPTLRSLI